MPVATLLQDPSNDQEWLEVFGPPVSPDLRGDIEDTRDYQKNLLCYFVLNVFELGAVVLPFPYFLVTLLRFLDFCWSGAMAQRLFRMS